MWPSAFNKNPLVEIHISPILLCLDKLPHNFSHGLHHPLALWTLTHCNSGRIGQLQYPSVRSVSLRAYLSFRSCPLRFIHKQCTWLWPLTRLTKHVLLSAQYNCSKLTCCLPIDGLPKRVMEGEACRPNRTISTAEPVAYAASGLPCQVSLLASYLFPLLAS